MSEMCRHCGFPKSGHYPANFSSGMNESVTILVCPTAVFEAREDRPLVKPAAATGPAGTVRV